MSDEAVMYPKNEFHAECRRIWETGGFAGETGRQITQLKFTYPGIINADAGLEYNLRAAVVLTAAGIRNDLNALWHQVTIKGIGAPKRGQRPHTSPTGETAEFIFEQIGLGGAQGLVKAWLNRVRYHVDHSIRHRIDLGTATGNFGRVDTATAVLHDADHLPNNGFPVDEFDLPEHASGVLLTGIHVTMSRKQLHQLLAQASNVSRKYDQTPRIVHRLHLPDSLFDNWGNNPHMQVLTRFASSQGTKTSMAREVPLDPVERSYQRQTT